MFGVHFQQITGKGSVGPLDVERFLLNGNTGVALFFGLSGFLLSLPFWRGDLSIPNQPWLGRYIRNRVVRILPAYYLCLTALVIYQRHWSGDDELRDTFSHYLLVQNCSEQFFYSISPPFWNIAVLVQFYVVLPLLFFLLCRTRKESVRVTVILALSITCYLLHYFLMEFGDQIGVGFGISNLVTSRQTVFSHSVLAHLPHLLWGSLAAWAYTKMLAAGPTIRRSPLCEIAVWLSGLAILAILATSLDDQFQVPHGRYNFPYIPALLAVIIACVPFTYLARRLLEFFPLRHLGEISYGIYIYHLSCLRLVERVFPQFGFSAQENWLLYGTIGLLLSILVATVSYVAIERPVLQYFRRRRESFSK